MSNKTGYGKLAKQLYSKEIQKDLDGAKNIIVAQFSQVGTNSMFDLRKKLRASKATFLVVKNTLGRRVLDADPYKGLSPLVNGQCGLGVTNEDVAKLSKTFVTFAEENPNFKINGAYVDGQIFSVDQVKSLASLPSREELLSKMLGNMKAPISNFVGVLNQVVTGIVNVLDQIRKSKEGK